LTKISPSRLRQELGGAGLLRTNGYVVIAVLSFTGSMLVGPAGATVNAWLWWPVHLISLLLCFGWYLIFRNGFFTNRETKPIALGWIAVFGISLGAVKGVSTGILAVLFGLEVDLPHAVGQRIVQTSFLGLFAVFGLALIEATLERYQVERDLLVTERVQQQIAGTGSRETRDSAELREFISVAKAKLESISKKPGDLFEQKQITAQLIRDIVETGLRPLSHRLWQKENAKVLNFSFADLAKIAVLGQPVAILPMAFIYFCGALATLAAHISFQDALLRSAIDTLILGLVYLVAGFAKAPAQWLAWLKFVLTALIGTWLIVVLPDIWFGSIAGISAIGIFAASFIWLIEVSFLSGFIVAAFESHVKVRSQLEALLRNAGADFATRKVQTLLLNRDLANYLHGSVQNRLLSAALRIENTDGDSVDLAQELKTIENLLDTAASGSRNQSQAELKQQLIDLAARWTGYVDVDFNLDQSTYGVVVDARIVQIANEAISNAVRHGLARNLEIKATRLASAGVEITATDDGLGPRRGDAGLGSALFDSLAGRSWSIVPALNGGSLLRIQLLE
jgi:hypothetical protein